MITHARWCAGTAAVEDDDLLQCISAMEAEALFLRSIPRPSLDLLQQIEGLEATIAEFYGLVDERHLSSVEWATASRTDLAQLAARIRCLSEGEFILWLACRADGEALGNAGVDGGVIYRYLLRTLNVPPAAVIPERQYVLLSDGRQTLRVALPAWAEEVNRLTCGTQPGSVRSQVRAGKLRGVLGLPRSRAVTGERQDD